MSVYTCAPPKFCLISRPALRPIPSQEMEKKFKVPCTRQSHHSYAHAACHPTKHHTMEKSRHSLSSACARRGLTPKDQVQHSALTVQTGSRDEQKEGIPMMAEVMAGHKSTDGMAVCKREQLVPDVLEVTVVEAAAVHGVVHDGRTGE